MEGAPWRFFLFRLGFYYQAVAGPGLGCGVGVLPSSSPAGWPAWGSSAWMGGQRQKSASRAGAIQWEELVGDGPSPSCLHPTEIGELAGRCWLSAWEMPSRPPPILAGRLA